MAPLGLTETSEGLVRALTERVPVGIFVTNAVGECVYGNELVLRLTGQTLEESLGYGWIRALHPEDAEQVQQAWSDAAAGRAEFSLEYRFLRPDGGVAWVAGTASDVRDPDGALLGWVGVCVDVTERKRSEERLRDMFEHARDAIYTCDLEGRFTSANLAAERLTGYSRQEILQMRVVDLIAPEDIDRARTLMARRLEGTHHGITDIQMVRKDGARLFVEISGRRVFRDSQAAGVEAIVRDVTAQHELQRRLEYQAFHDPLTGLPNRALLRDRLSQALVRATRSQSKVAVMLMDLDNFKLVNDTLGHAAGDELLMAISPRLHQAMRGGDTVARLGGDEFAFVLEGVAGERDAVAVAERVIAAFGEPFPTSHGEERIGASLGIVIAEPGADADTLLRNADTAMYAAKATSKGGYQLYDDERRLRMVREVEITNALTDVLAHDRLEVHYQPIVSLTDGQVLAVEALVRWHDADAGWISPSEFIPMAEANGLIGSLGQFVLERAACQMSTWRSEFPGQLPLGAFINVSPHQLAQAGFVDRVAGVLEHHGLGTGDIGIEVTEGVFIDDTGGTVGDNLAELARRGVRLSLDDFGTGYSALASLKRFPFSILKIDRFFIGSIRCPDDAAPITSSVVALGRTLGMTVVAEGIESDAQLELLQGLGCDAGQGYLLARPLAVDDLTELLETTNGRIAAVHGGTSRRSAA